MTKTSNTAIGICITLAGASLWGFSGSCTQYLFDHYQIDAMFITVFRMLVSGLIFLVALFLTQRDQLKAISKDRTSLRQLAFMGAVGLFLAQVTYIIAISYTNAGTATVLQSLSVVITMGVACLLAHRLPRRTEYLGVACALLATLLIATKGDLGTLSIPIAGLIWGLINAASVTLYIMYPKKLFARWSSMPVTGIAMLFGGISSTLIWALSCLVNLASGGKVDALASFPNLDATGWLMLGIIAVIGTFAAFGLYLKGVSMVGGVRGSMLGAIEPVSASVFSALWLGTAFAWADWMGLILMVATIFLVALQPSSKDQAAGRRPKAPQTDSRSA